MKSLTFIFSILSWATLAQINPDGYWDKDRATVKEINLCAECKTWISVELPVGTTEVGMRLTLLEKNQELSTSFASALGNIPEINSQLASASVSLLANISGDDKCKYFVFQKHEDADVFYNNGNTNNACYASPSPVNRDVIFLKNYCFTEDLQVLYFGFISTNLFLNERIILEVVPWINAVSSRGWTKTKKDNFIKECVSNLTNQFNNPEAVCLCTLEKLETKYKVEDIARLSDAERGRVAENMFKECVDETGEVDHFNNQTRQESAKLFDEGKIGEAIQKLIEVINSGKATWTDYNNVGFYYILTKQYLKAIKYLKQGELMDETELIIKGNLAHAYLLTGDLEAAKALYTKYKNQNISDKISWTEMVKLDFETFAKQGIVSEHFAEILALVN